MRRQDDDRQTLVFLLQLAQQVHAAVDPRRHAQIRDDRVEGPARRALDPGEGRLAVGFGHDLVTGLREHGPEDFAEVGLVVDDQYTWFGLCHWLVLVIPRSTGSNTVKLAPTSGLLLTSITPW